MNKYSFQTQFTNNLPIFFPLFKQHKSLGNPFLFLSFLLTSPTLERHCARHFFFHWGLTISSSCKFDLFTRRLILLVPIPGYSTKICKLEVLCILLILICVLTRKLILVVPTSGYSTKQEQRSRAQTTNNFTFKGISQ